jgi:hypothetical protein
MATFIDFLLVVAFVMGLPFLLLGAFFAWLFANEPRQATWKRYEFEGEFDRPLFDVPIVIPPPSSEELAKEPEFERVIGADMMEHLSQAEIDYLKNKIERTKSITFEVNK